MFTIDKFTNGLKILLNRIDIEDTQEELILKYSMTYEDDDSDNEDLIFNMSKNEIQNELNNLQNFRMEGFSLLNDNNFEVAVQILENKMPSSHYFGRDMFHTNGHGYDLSITKSSLSYIIGLICKIGNDNYDSQDIYHRLIFRPYFLSRLNTFEDFCDCFRILTAKIKADQNLAHNEFNKLLQSYIYNIAFNRNIVFSRIDFKEKRQPIRRRVNRNGQLFPYKNYNGELIKYYYQAISSSMPFTQYLAFYHVAEFFFQQIAESDAFETIESMITHPSFSPYKKEEIRRFYNKVKKVMRSQKEDGLWDEKNGLLICLKKFIPDLNLLKNSIDSIDNNALDYYKNNGIPFATNNSEQVQIDFDNTPEKIYNSIKNRVYLVRNAIAHSKEGDKLRYEPFKHDKDLQKEIPLIRAISEEIIINSSKPIDLKA